MERSIIYARRDTLPESFLHDGSFLHESKKLEKKIQLKKQINKKQKKYKVTDRGYKSNSDSKYTIKKNDR